MKSKLSFIWRVALTLAMVASLAMVFAPIPSVAAGGGSVCVDIIECPGDGDNPMGSPVTVSSKFGIKANITNNTEDIARDVIASIGIDGPAELIEESPVDIEVPNMDVGQTQEVGWTLHCTAPGLVTVTVYTCYSSTEPCTWDSCTFDQKEPANLTVVVDAPCEVGTGCSPDNQFKVYATVTNTGDVGAHDVIATITKSTPPGYATITTPYQKSLGIIPAGGSVPVNWVVTCDGAGDVTFTVTASGYEDNTGTALGPVPGSATTHQRDVIVDVCAIPLSTTLDNHYPVIACHFKYLPAYSIDPITGCSDAIVVSTEQKFGVKATVKNEGAQARPINVTLVLPTGTQLSADPVHVEPAVGAPYDLAAGTLTVILNNVCPCCEVKIKWILECTLPSSGQAEPIIVEARTPAPASLLLDSNADCQPATVTQEKKVHLVNTTAAYVFDCDPVNGEVVNTVAVGQDFDVLINVQNTGEALAEGVVVDINVTGPVTCAGTYTNLSIGDIEPGEGETVSVWLNGLLGTCALKCTEEGTVTISVLDIRGLDENTGEQIKEPNIQQACPLIIKQVPFMVQIIEPTAGTDITECTTFTVKALLTNSSLTKDINDLTLNLTWSGSGDVELYETQDNPIVIPLVAHAVMENTTLVPTLNEVTWQVVCTSQGDVTFHVCATSEPIPGLHLQVLDVCPVDGYDCEGTCDDYPVTVQQIEPEPAHLSMEIVSPDNLDSFIATGQEFAVTAILVNEEHHATVTIENVHLVFYPDSVAFVEGGLQPTVPFDIPAGGSKTITWTLQCTQGGLVGMDAIVCGHSEICQHAFTWTFPLLVWQYPAAHLDAEILSVTPSSPINSGTDFEVAFKVTNTGEADATEVKAVLTVTPDGSVLPAVGDNSFTINIGTLPGHGSTENVYTGTYYLHSASVGNSNITISASGYDEYGWHKKQVCQSTGNFIIEAGGLYTTDTGNQESSTTGAQVGVFIGEASGLIGPFNFDTPISWIDFSDSGDNTGTMTGMGVVIPNLDYTGCFNQVKFLQMMLIQLGKDPGLDLLDILNQIGWQGVNKDVMIYIGHITMNPEAESDIPHGWSNVAVGYLQIINGHFTGSSAELTDDSGVFSWLDGTYCSTMAQEALRAIDAKFIEPASVTVKQLPSGGLDLGITKTVSDFAPEVGDDVTYTIIVTNYGPNVATGVKVTDYVWPTPSYTITQGTYNASTGIWSVGNMAVGTLATMMVTVDVASPAASTNTATVTCDQPDGVPFNNAASVTINGFPIVKANSFTLALNEGWNFISWPLIPTDSTPTPAELLAELISPDLFGIVWGNYNATSGYWQSYAPPPTGGDLTSMRDGIGFWIWMDSAATLTVSGTELPPPPNTPPTYNVLGGRWNVIGFKSPTAKIPANYLGGIANKYTVIYGYKDGMYFLVGTPANPFLEPGLAYWIAVQQDGIIYP